MFLWLVIIPNIAAAPFFVVVWLSNKAFGRDKEGDV